MKLPKLLLLLLAIIAIVVIFLLFHNPTGPTTDQNTPATDQKPAEKKGGVFESIKDAMSKSLSLKCEYPTEKGKVIAYIKGSSIRIDGSWSGANEGSAIVKEDKIWTWNNDGKEGIIFPIQSDQAKGQGVNPDDLVNDFEKEKQFCSTAVFSDSVFDPPQDINFKDFSDLLKQISGAQEQPSPAGEN